MTHSEEQQGKTPSDQQQRSGQPEHSPASSFKNVGEQADAKSETTSRNDYNQGLNKRIQMGVLMWKIFDGKSGMWSAIFAGFLVVFTFLLYKVADRQDETSRMTQRATVSFGGLQAGQKIISPDGKKWMAEQVLVVWANSGETPARTGLSQSNWQAWPYELPDGFNFPDLATSDKRPFVLSPKGIGSTPLVIPMENFDSVIQGKSHTFVWGWVVYHDIFQGTSKHLTEYCVELANIRATKPDVTDPTADLTWQTTTCKEHNCYDEDCIDFAARTK